MRSLNDAQFDALVRQHVPAIFRYARRFTGDRDIAEDIAQETFVKAWKNLKRYDPSRSFSAWLYTIAQRTAIDYLRKKSDEPLPEELLDTAPSVLETLDMARENRALALATAQLPSEYRAVVQLRLQDLQFHEIAERLKKPLNTVKSQYRRALGLLKRALHQNS
jgi:RNA polymerase sigma factor (sigma-70 family)